MQCRLHLFQSLAGGTVHGHAKGVENRQGGDESVVLRLQLVLQQRHAYIGGGVTGVVARGGVAEIHADLGAVLRRQLAGFPADTAAAGGEAQHHHQCQHKREKPFHIVVLLFWENFLPFNCSYLLDGSDTGDVPENVKKFPHSVLFACIQ